MSDQIWLDRIAELVASDGLVARITIIDVRGPTPRETGAALLVTARSREGALGGGGLESRAIAAARTALGAATAGGAPGKAYWLREILSFETGLVLGATSGGRIDLLMEIYGEAEVAALKEQPWFRAILARPLIGGAAIVIRHDDGAPPSGPPLPGDIETAIQQLRAAHGRPRLLVPLAKDAGGETWLIEQASPRGMPFHVYGTGPAGRALVKALGGLPFEVLWVATDPDQFPDEVPPHVRPLTAADPAEVARAAPAGAFHAVMTASHDLDHAVALALLTANTFGFAGVIGSGLKAERLRARLREAGIAARVLDRLACPVGLSGIKGKQPAVIAISIAAQALVMLHQADTPGTKR